jgi:nucleoside-diphosphate-sugar epimerase
MRVAVTGAGGFIGGHLVPHLRGAGHEVVVLTRSTDGRGFVRSPSTSPSEELLEGVDGVIHLAGRQVDRPLTPLEEYLPSNVILTERLLLAAKSAGVGRFVLASSRLVYPASVQGPARESCPDSPDTFYGLSKRIGENLVAIHSTDALSGVALRIGQVFGRGDRDRGVLPRFIEGARRGVPPAVAGSGAAVRDFVHVDDVIEAFRLAIERTTTVPAINIGGGRGHSILELARMTAIAAGMEETSVRHQPADVDDTSHYSMDCSLAADELGWAPKVGMADRIRQRLSENA